MWTRASRRQGSSWRSRPATADWTVACTVTPGPDHLAVWAFASDVAVVATAWDLVQRQRDAGGSGGGIQLGTVLISYALGTTGRGPPAPATSRGSAPLLAWLRLFTSDALRGLRFLG